MVSFQQFGRVLPPVPLPGGQVITPPMPSGQRGPGPGSAFARPRYFCREWREARHFFHRPFHGHSMPRAGRDCQQPQFIERKGST